MCIPLHQMSESCLDYVDLAQPTLFWPSWQVRLMEPGFWYLVWTSTSPTLPHSLNIPRPVQRLLHAHFWACPGQCQLFLARSVHVHHILVGCMLFWFLLTSSATCAATPAYLYFQIPATQVLYPGLLDSCCLSIGLGTTAWLLSDHFSWEPSKLPLRIQE